MTRARLRDLGVVIGRFPTGEHNALTDVPGVRIGHATLIEDAPHVVRTGVTVIVPGEGEVHRHAPFAGYSSFNGYGEMTGLLWVEESGLLTSPIALTNTNQVGTVSEALVALGAERFGRGAYALPVVGETYDGWLSQIDAFPLRPEHVRAALDGAAGGPVAEGNVGGGTGMICHDFKGGIGTASRRVTAAGEAFIVGALVQANHGDRALLRVDGVPVGQALGPEHTPLPWSPPESEGSILIVLATDAPLLPVQCKRLARRAAVGLARTGGIGHNGSGDLFLAFATGNRVPDRAGSVVDLRMLPHTELNPLFEAAAEAVEEAILNALTAAETMTGQRGRVVHALPLEPLRDLMLRLRPPA